MAILKHVRALLLMPGARPLAARVGGQAALAVAVVALTGVLSAAAPPTEYQVKAVFLFNFSQFVDWPQSAFATPDAPLVIGVLGEDPFGAQLDEVVKGEIVRGHPLQVRRFTTLDEISGCHILFVSASEERRLDDILRRLKGRSILTVSDKGDFAHRGGMILLVTERDRVRMRINLEATGDAGLTLSSKLLRPAEIVRPKGG